MPELNPYAYTNPYQTAPYGYSPLLPTNNYQQYLQQPAQQQPQTPTAIKCRPVTGPEEARAFSIDYDGSINVFMDISNGKIYTKQLGADGLSIFNTYALQKEVIPPAPVDVAALQAKVESLEQKLERMMLNVQFPASDATPTEQRKSSSIITGVGRE